MKSSASLAVARTVGIDASRGWPGDYGAGTASSEGGGNRKSLLHTAIKSRSARLIARTPGTFAFHPANGGARRRVEAALLKGLGVVPDVPDVIAIKAGRVQA